MGYSIMEGAIKNSISGIDADCGGSCACATCHVYVDENFLSKIPKAQESEQDMIDFIQDADKSSRLSCQIMITNDLDGIVVRMPEKQS
ncbi:MAG: 2Fe-2S ferredoxin [Proteobacteria bacterium]|nr:2Fe-2S ferredoxin [Candidatus Fonsibacter sp. PEL4]